MTNLATAPESLLADIRALIEDARHQVARAANVGLTIAYWRIGKRLLAENLTDGRGKYGQKILATLAQQLEREFGKGFSYSALTRMARFAEQFPDERILAALIQELTWTHFLALLPLKDPLAREFYAEMCRVEHWSVRALRQKIGSMLFERTALSKNSEEVIRQELATLRDGRMTPDLVFRDPYLLDFLGLSGAYSEKDLEAAILREMETVLLEMGSGFCFVARQKRMSVGKDDFYLDLLFYHRHLRRLVAVELKLESFQPAHTGQMELYLRWLDKHERASGEDAPIGLILCAGADAEQVELLQLEGKSIRVAEYLVELPSADVLRERLHRAIAHARERSAILAAPEEKQV
jgi:predicted nuclease of restriction endonuclease-like (RecB) superfamily